MHNDKHSEEVLIEGALKTTIQILYVKGLFDNYASADEVLKDYLFVKVNEKRRLDLKPINDDKAIQGFYS